VPALPATLRGMVGCLPNSAPNRNAIEEKIMEHWRNPRIVYDGAIFRVKAGKVELDNGDLAHREVVEHPGGVCVVPYTGESVILVRQYRIALDDFMLEAPAGKREKNEPPEDRARAELEEETGYRAKQLVPAGVFFSTVGYCSERMHLFLALDLEKCEARPDPEERIEIVELSIGAVRRQLKAHHFADAKTALVLRALLDHIDGTGEHG
jgi:ADP-ribose pyrophosphatase